MKQTNNTSNLKFLALLFGIIFISIGLVSIFVLVFLGFNIIIIDPIEQLIVILIGIIFLRGFIDLQNHKSSGEAYIFVGTIIGIVLGTLASLEFLFVGLIEGLLNEDTLPTFTSHFISYLFNPALILGFLSFLPHKMIKQREKLDN